MNAAQLFGRLHPLVIHFPVALLVLAAGIELARVWFDRSELRRLVPLLLTLGAVGAFVASITGWVFAHDYHPQPSLRWMLEWHRWLGIATAALAAIAAWASTRWADTPDPAGRCLRRAAVWLTTVLLGVAAHLGALMVWGEDYFSS